MIIQIIEISSDQVTCARFKRKGQQLEPVLGIQLELSGLNELGSLLQRELPELTEEHRTIVALHTSKVTLRELQLPISDRKKLRAILPMELMGESGEDARTIIADALAIGEGQYLAGWADQSQIEELIAQLQPVGFDPEVVTCAPLNWHQLMSDTPDTILFQGDTALTIASNGQLQFCRLMATSDQSALSRTITSLELSRSLKPVANYSIDQVNRTGCQPLPMPPELMASSGSGDLPPQALFSCLAMARAYIKGEIFNLRTGNLAWSGAKSLLLRRFRLPMILGVITLLLLFGESGLRWYLLKRDLGSINNSISQIYKGIFPNRTRVVDEVGEVRSEIRRLQSGGDSVELLGFLKLLAEAKEEQLTGFSEVEYDDQRFRLKGDATSQQAINSLIQKLTNASLVAEPPELTSRSDGSQLFTIKGQKQGGMP